MIIVFQNFQKISLVICVCVLMALFMFASIDIEPEASTKFSNKNNMRISHTTLSNKSWTIIYDENKLRENIQMIHDKFYAQIAGDECKKRFPGALIVGVSKCGTRELSDFIGMHPNIVPKGSRTGISYKVPPGLFKNETDVQPIIDKMPCTYTDQIGTVKQDFFFFEFEMPRILFNFDPNLKIIAIVREPMSRIISHKSFRMGKHGNEQDDMSLDRKLFTNGVLNIHSKFLRLSNYADCYERYLKYFPKNQILILETGEFNRDPVSVLKRVETFLGLEPFKFEDFFVKNEETGFSCVRAVDKENEMACYNSNRGRTGVVSTLSDEQLAILNQYFTPVNERFFFLLENENVA